MKQVYLDGHFIRQAVAGTGVACLKSGAGLFETMRVRHARVYLLERHLERLHASCPVVGLKAPSCQELAGAVRELIRRNGLRDGALRLVVSTASVADGVCGGASRRKTEVCIVERPLPVEISSKKAPVFSAVLYDKERAGFSGVPCVKTTHRDFYRRVGLFAASRKADEAFFLNAGFEVVEGSRTNVFCVKQGDVLTPSLESGCLPGITRARVLELLAGMKVRCYETAFGPEWLYGCDEIFVTNALVGVAAVTRYNGKPVGCGHPGPVTSRLVTVYQNDIEKTCRIR
ncbi:MAG: aminotransferase class IV [Candidatus Velamenicoccus archaeovorus]